MQGGQAERIHSALEESFLYETQLQATEAMSSRFQPVMTGSGSVQLFLQLADSTQRQVLASIGNHLPAARACLKATAALQSALKECKQGSVWAALRGLTGQSGPARVSTATDVSSAAAGLLRVAAGEAGNLAWNALAVDPHSPVGLGQKVKHTTTSCVLESKIAYSIFNAYEATRAEEQISTGV